MPGSSSYCNLRRLRHVSHVEERTRPGSRQAPRKDTMLGWRSACSSSASCTNACSRRWSALISRFTATRPCHLHRPRYTCAAGRTIDYMPYRQAPYSKKRICSLQVQP